MTGVIADVLMLFALPGLLLGVAGLGLLAARGDAVRDVGRVRARRRADGLRRLLVVAR